MDIVRESVYGTFVLHFKYIEGGVNSAASLITGPDYVKHLFIKTSIQDFSYAARLGASVISKDFPGVDEKLFALEIINTIHSEQRE